MAIDDHVRVCYGCYIKLKLSRVAKKGPVIPPPQLVPTPKNTTRHEETTTSAPVVNGSEDKQFEEDLKRAIELSKAEAEQHHYAPSAAAVAKDTDLRSTTQYGLVMFIMMAFDKYIDKVLCLEWCQGGGGRGGGSRTSSSHCSLST